MTTLKINGVSLESALGSKVFDINEIKGRGPSRREATLLEVPGRHGAYLRRIKTPPRELEVSFTLRATSVPDLRTKVDRLNEIVTTKGVVPIEFSDENKTYYGVLTDTTAWDEIRNFGQGTFKFTCPDPFKYTAEDNAQFNPVTDSVTFATEGNEATAPRFEAYANAPVTHVDFVRHDGEYMRIGRPANAGDTVFERETLIMHDTMDTLTGWTDATYADNGHIAGRMTATGGAFTAGAYGQVITPEGWQGPAVKRSIGEELDQFRVDVLVESINSTTGAQVGQIEIYLLDADNNTVAKLGVADTNRTITETRVKMQLGNEGLSRYDYYRLADNVHEWDDFDGMLRLTRTKTAQGMYVYQPYFAMIAPNGKHYSRSTKWLYYDHAAMYTRPITQVQVAIRVWPELDQTEMRVHDIKIYRLNEQPEGVPIILDVGDHLVIDHATEDILINGESRKDLKDFGATFFPLEPGSNTIHQYPTGALTTNVYWRDKYK